MWNIMATDALFVSWHLLAIPTFAPVTQRTNGKANFAKLLKAQVLSLLQPTSVYIPCDLWLWSVEHNNISSLKASIKIERAIFLLNN
jgi:hypothetical protein